MLPSCAVLGGFAIGARVALLWQHNANAKCQRVHASTRSMPSFASCSELQLQETQPSVSLPSCSLSQVETDDKVDTDAQCTDSCRSLVSHQAA